MCNFTTHFTPGRVNMVAAPPSRATCNPMPDASQDAFFCEGWPTRVPEEMAPFLKNDVYVARELCTAVPSAVREAVCCP